MFSTGCLNFKDNLMNLKGHYSGHWSLQVPLFQIWCPSLPTLSYLDPKVVFWWRNEISIRSNFFSWSRMQNDKKIKVYFVKDGKCHFYSSFLHPDFNINCSFKYMFLSKYLIGLASMMDCSSSIICNLWEKTSLCAHFNLVIWLGHH